MSQCFLDKDRECSAECIAHAGPPESLGGRPQCTFLNAATAVLRFCWNQTTETAVVRHPVSAPPPEVT